MPGNIAEMVYTPGATGSRWEPFQWLKGEDYARIWAITPPRVLRWSTDKNNLAMNRTESPEVEGLFEWVKGYVHDVRACVTPPVRHPHLTQHLHSAVGGRKKKGVPRTCLWRREG